MKCLDLIILEISRFNARFRYILGRIYPYQLRVNEHEKFNSFINFSYEGNYFFLIIQPKDFQLYLMYKQIFQKSTRPRKNILTFIML